MLFASPIFLFIFLPFSLIGYYVLKFNRNLQNIFLFVMSIVFYAWGEPRFSLILLCSIIVNWLIALSVSKTEDKVLLRKILLVLDIVLNIGLLFVYKYLDFTITLSNKLFSTDFTLQNIILPIGISFFTFQALSYVIDVYRGEEAQQNPLNVGLYIAFFPQLIAGPIVRYNSIADQIKNRKESYEKFSNGIKRFMQGFAKKVLIANSMAVIADKAFEMPMDKLTASFAWLGAFAYMMQIYFDFSGYSDMAIGLGKMFGFEFEENFNYPYLSTSITDFWRRWHISLSSWFRDYVYIPLGGNRGTKYRNYFNLFVVWLLTGIWHGANFTFIIWGLFYFVLLVFEKNFNLKPFFESHTVLGRVYALLAVLFAWVLFRADSVSTALLYIRSMFTFSNNNLGLAFVYLKENCAFVIVAILLSLGIYKGIAKYEEKYKVIEVICEVLLTTVFVISIVYVINGTYNPFIYFNF